MATITRPGKKGFDAKSKQAKKRTRVGTQLAFLEGHPTALSRSTSLDTIAVRIPRRVRLVPNSGSLPRAAITIELPEGTVVRLLALDERNELVDTIVDGWLPAGTHELRNLCLPNGAYKLRLETPNAWHVAGILIG